MLFLLLFLFLSITFLCITPELFLNLVVFITRLISLSSVNFNNFPFFLSKFQQNLEFLVYQELPLVFNFLFFIGVILVLGFLLNFLNPNVTGFGLAKVIALFLTFYSIRLIFVFWNDIDVAYLLVVSYCIFILGFCYKVFLEVCPEFQSIDGDTNKIVFFFCFFISLFTPFFIWIFLWFLIYSLFFILEKLFFGIKNEMFWLNFVNMKKLEFFYVFFLMNLIIVEITGESLLIWLSLIIEYMWIKFDVMFIPKVQAEEQRLLEVVKLVNKTDLYVKSILRPNFVNKLQFPNIVINYNLKMSDFINDTQKFSSGLQIMHTAANYSYWFANTKFSQMYFEKSLLRHKDVVLWSQANKQIFSKNLLEFLTVEEKANLLDKNFRELFLKHYEILLNQRAKQDEKFRYFISMTYNIVRDSVEMNRVVALNLGENKLLKVVLEKSPNFLIVDAVVYMDETNGTKLSGLPYPKGILKGVQQCIIIDGVFVERVGELESIVKYCNNCSISTLSWPVDHLFSIKRGVCNFDFGIQLQNEERIAFEVTSGGEGIQNHLKKDWLSVDENEFEKKVQYLRSQHITQYNYYVKTDINEIVKKKIEFDKNYITKKLQLRGILFNVIDKDGKKIC